MMKRNYDIKRYSKHYEGNHSKSKRSKMAFGLDGLTAEIHDYFRGTEGALELRMNAIRYLYEVEIPIQIHTVISKL